MSVVVLEGPADPDVPLLLDSPHSGAQYPADFRPEVAMERCRRAEDFDVDVLFGEAPALGIPLWKALFPRIYVDVNRDRGDLDPAMVDGVLPFPLAPSAKARLGKGVIWMDAPPPPEPTPLYAEALSAPDIAHRLKNHWEPYRHGLAERLSAIRLKHGRAYYLDCHSMPSVSSAMHEEGAGIARAEIVLGDGDGTTCSGNFTRRVAELLAAEGFEVAVNTPYKGADLIRKEGRPAEGLHALQIEVRRDLYMNENAVTRSPRFADTRARLGKFLAALQSELANNPI